MTLNFKKNHSRFFYVKTNLKTHKISVVPKRRNAEWFLWNSFILQKYFFNYRGSEKITFCHMILLYKKELIWQKNFFHYLGLIKDTKNAVSSKVFLYLKKNPQKIFPHSPFIIGLNFLNE